MKMKSASHKFLKKNWQYLFWLGPVLSIAGLTAGGVSGEWFPIPMGFIVAGITIVGWWLIYQTSTTKGFWTRRSIEVASNALIATISVLAILGLINFIGLRYPLRLDLTENQQLTLSPQSKGIVRNLGQPVKVWLFSPEKDPADVALLEDYKRFSNGNFSYQYVDLQAEPGLVEKFDIKSLGEVYLETGETRQFMQNLQGDRLSEAKLTNRLAQLLTGTQPTVYFLQGHGEKDLEAEQGGLSQATQILQEKGYGVEALNLVVQSKVPEEAAVVVVAGATGKLFEPEVKALQDYLDGGGGVLLAIDPKTDPGLKSLLENWGIATDDRTAIDPDRWVEGFGPQAPLVIDYGNHPITQDFGEDFSLFPLARSLAIEDKEGIESMPLLFTSDASWAESDLDQKPEWKFDLQSDRQGPLVLGVALSRSREEATSTSEANADDEKSENAKPETAESAETDAETDSEVTETEATDAANTDNATDLEAPETEVSDSPETPPELDEAATEPEALEPTEPEENITETAEETIEESETPSATDTELTEPETDTTSEPSSESESEQAEEKAETENKTESDSEQASKESRLVIFGDSDFFSNGFFQRVQLNGDLFLNSVSWLSQGDTEILSVRPKEPKNRTLPMTPQQARILVMAIAAFPVMGFATAGMIWWSRR